MVDACVVKNSKSKSTVAKNLLEAFDTEDEEESSDSSKNHEILVANPRI